jgi:Spore coat assembly protein
MKYFLLSLGLILSFAIGGKCQTFYDIKTINTIEITFAESNWDALLDAEKAGDDGYIKAQSVTINGVTFNEVGVKYKGNSTYNANQTKNPFHIELDTYTDQDYEGYTDIKLSNEANDPSFVREALSYQILRQYMDAPLSNFANVYVNGKLLGLYTSSESISKKFVKSHFGSKKNTFVKCNPPDGADQSTTDLPNLVYLGQDSTSYYDAYELESDYGWKELINLCDTLTNNIGAIEKILDVDRALWMLAFDNALVNLDSYIGAYSQNYYLYRDDNGRFIPIVWDLNESFGQFSQTGTSSLNSTSDKQKLSYLLHASDTKFPLIKMLLSVPMYKRMYLAHIKTIMLENFDNKSYYDSGLSMQATIDAAVSADIYKFYTYSNFLNNLTTDISSGMGGPGSSSTPGITNLMNGRNSYLLALSDFTNTAPGITDITLSDAKPVINSTITVSASITNATSVYLGFRSSSELPFTRIQMYDDGTHNDLVAGDGIYSTPLTIDNASIQYYIYAENDKVGMFSPQRAEHEYHVITASDGDVSGVVINEFLASNEATMADQDNEYDDWIELYNNSNETVDLGGYYLSDDSEDLTQWTFPIGTTIGANGYLIVWADKDEDQTGLHANFKISASSGKLFLVNSAGSVINEINYSAQTTDVSFGRYPNGTGDFQTMEPTFEAENRTYTSVDPVTVQSTELIAYPNPASDYFNIDISGDLPQNDYVTIYNVAGNVVLKTKSEAHLQISTSGWSTGIYFIQYNGKFFKMVIL